MKEQNAREWLIKNSLDEAGIEWFDDNFSPKINFIELWSKIDNLEYLFFIVERLGITSPLAAEKDYFLSKLKFHINTYLNTYLTKVQKMGLISFLKSTQCKRILNFDEEADPLSIFLNDDSIQLSPMERRAIEYLYLGLLFRNKNPQGAGRNFIISRETLEGLYDDTDYYDFELAFINAMKVDLSHAVLTAHEHHFNCRFFNNRVNKEYCNVCKKIINKREKQMIDRSLTISVPYTREDGTEPSLTFKHTGKVGTLYLNGDVIFDTGLDSEKDLKEAKEFAHGLALLAKELETFCSINK